MVGKLTKASLLLLILTAVFAGTVLAEEELHIPKVRVLGDVTAINPDENTFSLKTRQGEDLRFLVIDRTKFRSPDGSLNGLEDMEVGMKALVVGVLTGLRLFDGIDHVRRFPFESTLLSFCPEEVQQD